MASTGIKWNPTSIVKLIRVPNLGFEFQSRHTCSMLLQQSSNRTKQDKYYSFTANCKLYSSRGSPLSAGRKLTPPFLGDPKLWSKTSRTDGVLITFVSFKLNDSKRKYSLAKAGCPAGTCPSRNFERVMVTCLHTSKHFPRRVMAITVAATADSDHAFPSQDEGEGRATDFDRGKERAIPRMPSPEIEPAEVVQAQLQALRRKDVMTVFEFASPKNKAHTGPLSRFTEMIQGRAYNVMLEHVSADVLSTLSIDPGRFQQRVLIKGANGNRAVFSWSLSRQENDPFQGCWMTDSVHRDE